jgi:hypothetical protein
VDPFKFAEGQIVKNPEIEVNELRIAVQKVHKRMHECLAKYSTVELLGLARLTRAGYHLSAK